MIGITVFRDRMIKFSTLKHFWKHFAHGQVKKPFSVTRDDKDTDKDEALFNVAYNVTDNISSQAILQHNTIFNRYLPALLYLPSTTPFYASVSKGVANTIFNLWYGRSCYLNPLAPKADALPSEPSRWLITNLHQPIEGITWFGNAFGIEVCHMVGYESHDRAALPRQILARQK